MCACFSLLLGLGICAVLFAVFLALWMIPALFVFRFRHKILWGLASVPTFLILLTCAILWMTRPSATFELALGFPPPADVTGLQSRQWILGDSGEVYLRFRASPATIKQIVARGLSPSSGSTDSGNSPPDWWKPSQGAEIYEAAFRDRKFASEHEYFACDPATGDAWFRWIGID